MKNALIDGGKRKSCDQAFTLAVLIKVKKNHCESELNENASLYLVEVQLKKHKFINPTVEKKNPY